MPPFQLALAHGAAVFTTVSEGQAGTARISGCGQTIDRDALPSDYLAPPYQRRRLRYRLRTHSAERRLRPLSSRSKRLHRPCRQLPRLGYALPGSVCPFRAATYSGVFTLLPLLTGAGLAHHRTYSSRSLQAGGTQAKLHGPCSMKRQFWCRRSRTRLCCGRKTAAKARWFVEM